MKDFTFIVMVYNLNNVSSLQDIEQARAAEILNQLSGIDTTNYNVVTIENLPKRINNSWIYNNTEIFDITGQGAGSKPGRNRLFTAGKANVGDTDGLAGILLLIKAMRPAGKYVIFTFDHSNFIGQAVANIVNRTAFAAMAFQPRKDGVLPVHPMGEEEIKDKIPGPSKRDQILFAKNTYDVVTVSKHDMLTNAELANALFKAFNLNKEDNESGRVEAVFFNTCYTGCIDNFYLYSNVVNYIVSSEGEVYYDSINIKKVIGYFLESKDDTSLVVNRCIKNFRDDFAGIHPAADAETTESLEHMILTAVNLSDNPQGTFQQRFLKLFNPLVKSLISDIERVYKTISTEDGRGAWRDCFNIYEKDSPLTLGKDPLETYTYCYDVFSFFNTLKKDEALKGHAGDMDLLVNFLHGIQLDMYRGDEVYDSFNGLSIFLSLDAGLLGAKKKEQLAYNYSPFSDFQNDFARHTLWPEFLQLLNKLRQAELNAMSVL